MLDLTFIPAEGSRLPLYEQLYRYIADQIRRGAIPVGTRLPGKRTMAAQLAVSVNTVDTAYQLLTAEGYLEVRPRSGFFVQEVEHLLSPEVASPAPELSGSAAAAPPIRYNLTTGGVDTRLFPFRTWGRIQRELLYNNPELLHRGHPQGDENLRCALAEYLRAYRGVRCTPDQLVMGAGVEYLLGLLSRLLDGKTAAVENPGYTRPRRILENNGIPCVPVGIDSGGLRVDLLQESGADLCYVTPSHHFPTGATMPAGRRGQLLFWAAASPGRYILEDDYDAEFRFDIRPLPSLQGMAGPDGPVVYFFTFSKSLAPSIRMAGMVLPPDLLEKYRRLYQGYSSTVSRYDQQTMALFLQRGHFSRHLARLRSLYRQRMEQLSADLTAAFGNDRISLQGQHNGLHLLLTLHDGPDEQEMVKKALQAGVRLQGLSEYYMAHTEVCPANTVVLDYARLPTEQTRELAELLKQAWEP